jgi:hypothetical protein
VLTGERLQIGRIGPDRAEDLARIGRLPPDDGQDRHSLRQRTVNKQRQHGRTPDQSFSLIEEYSPTADRAGWAEQFHARM